MLRIAFINATQLVMQSIDDLEKVGQAVDTSRVTGWHIVTAIIVFVASWPIGLLAGRLVGRLVGRLPAVPDYAPNIAKRAARYLVVFIALAIALNVLGVNVGWFTVTLGLIVVVAVLMIRPLIESLAAGFLLQTRPSFHIGDEIETNGHRGKVLDINARTTVIQTRDWRSIHVPNTDVLSEVLIVLTTFERRRSAIELDIEYGVDVAEASDRLVEAASGVEGVHADPPPYVRARGFGTATYTLSLRWWHDPDLSSGSRTLDGVVREVKRALDEAGIEMPSPEVIVRQPDVAED